MLGLFLINTTVLITDPVDLVGQKVRPDEESGLRKVSHSRIQVPMAGRKFATGVLVAGPELQAACVRGYAE